jgi:pyruvate, orthophosphate dikinase
VRTPLIVPFSRGDRSMADLLGGKGANLAEMTRLGLPVPEGFTVTTEMCRRYLRTGHLPEQLDADLRAAVHALERATGRRLGDPRHPLLVSVRSGARFSMPGMMDTVLDVGLTDEVVAGLAARAGAHFAWDCYRRLIQMYGCTVLGLEGASFDAVLADAVRAEGVADDTRLSADALRHVVGEFRSVLRSRAGADLPQSPSEQVRVCLLAVFASWNSPRARLYRRHEGIDDELGTAVSVVRMVYGNAGPRSGTGVCFTRDPTTGEPRPYGDYLPQAQGEDVVGGGRRTVPLSRLADLEPAVHAELLGHLDTLEKHYRDLCDVEFTVENGRLWLLQTRVGQRSADAAFVVADDLARAGLVDGDEALLRVSGHQLESLLHPRFDDGVLPPTVVTGLPASPGASVGVAVFTSAAATAARARGEDAVLLRPETNPQDLPGILAAVAVVTSRGGLASHAAVVARGLGRTCVTGASGLLVDPDHGVAHTPDGVGIREGDTLSVDGSTGRVYRGGLPVRPSPVAAALRARPAHGRGGGSPTGERIVDAVLAALERADARARMTVRANAETAEQAETARVSGAVGIGLCRTEHMLLGERRVLVEQVVLEDDPGEALARIEELAVEELGEVLRAMDGRPVVVRLLDPPLHEFLPEHEELAVAIARLHGEGQPVPAAQQAHLDAVGRWQQVNPMLGLRGVRLLTIRPELVDVHVRALVTATVRLRSAGLHPRPEIMIPLVSEPREFAAARDRVLDVARRAAGDLGAPDLVIPVGVMIELPRAALVAGQLAQAADFFSFGTNDLTQTTWGISRDDGQAGFLAAYQDAGLIPADPFEHLDEDGVGLLVRAAARDARAVRPDLGLGVCGEHAGDPDSILFFERCGIDYLSCSPPRIPVARLEAGRAALLAAGAPPQDTR